MDDLLKPGLICGFAFGRNLTKLNYPVEAAVKSILPICDKYVYVVGKSEDDTRERVAAIDPDKIEIIDSVWPEDMKDGGKVLAVEANKAMEAAERSGCTWGFYGQADEVYHENDLPRLVAACEHWKDETDVKALLFRYYHFVLDYVTTDPWMYHKASRIVRLDQSCFIVGDCCGPGIKDYAGPVHGGNGYLDKHHLGGHVRWAGDPTGQTGKGPAHCYHYGWVKSREQIDTKLEMVQDLWWGDLETGEGKKKIDSKFGGLIAKYPILKNFKQTHPAVMNDLIAERPPLDADKKRWLNPRFYAEVLKHGYHG